MSKVVFFGIPSYGHINPTLGLVSELVKNGEEVMYFASEEFRVQVEGTGAIFKAYAADLNLFKIPKGLKPGMPGGLARAMGGVLASAEVVIADILEQIKDHPVDYIIRSAAFPFTEIMVQLLKVPVVSSLAIFLGLDKMMKRHETPGQPMPPEMLAFIEYYKGIAQNIENRFGVKMPDTPMGLLTSQSDINLVYTSRYFAGEQSYFNDSYKFVGPPVYQRTENVDFPFEQLHGKKVLYISLGTIFGDFNHTLYNIFFEGFANWDGVVVMAAFGVDLSELNIPDNFMVRNYVPQLALLQHTSVAITHAGMNSISDLISSNVPFVALPLGADQPLLAKRAEELGAAISLDAETLSAEVLRASIEEVLTNPSYKQNGKKIDESFKAAGGYPSAVAEIFKLKKEKGVR